VPKNTLLFISSLDSFFSAHDHNFCDVSKLAFFAAKFQAAFQSLSVTNKN